MRIFRSISLATLSFCLALVSNGQTKVVQTEKDFYSLRTIAIPQEIKLEVGGVAVMPDGRIAASTRRGEIWIIENAYGSGQPYFSKFASGLHEASVLNKRSAIIGHALE